MHWVKKINNIQGYKISLTFEDNVTKVVDLENELWGEIFEPLKDLEYFKHVKVINDTIVWPNEADFSPNFLYNAGKEVKIEKQKTKPIKRSINRNRSKLKN